MKQRDDADARMEGYVGNKADEGITLEQFHSGIKASREETKNDMKGKRGCLGSRCRCLPSLDRTRDPILSLSFLPCFLLRRT